MFVLVATDHNDNLLQEIVTQLTIPTHNIDIDLDLLPTTELRPHVTGQGCSAKILVGGHELHIHGFITPGEWYTDMAGNRNRRYGGQYEVMNLQIQIPAEIQGDNILRDYGTYNRQVVDGQSQWVRIDEFPDFLGIDGKHIQVIQPLCN